MPSRTLSRPRSPHVRARLQNTNAALEVLRANARVHPRHLWAADALRRGDAGTSWGLMHDVHAAYGPHVGGAPRVRGGGGGAGGAHGHLGGGGGDAADASTQRSRCSSVSDAPRAAARHANGGGGRGGAAAPDASPRRLATLAPAPAHDAGLGLMGPGDVRPLADAVRPRRAPAPPPPPPGGSPDRLAAAPRNDAAVDYDVVTAGQVWLSLVMRRGVCVFVSAG